VTAETHHGSGAARGGEGHSAQWCPVEEVASVDDEGLDGAQQLQGGKGDHEAIMIQRVRSSEGMLTGKGEKAVLQGGTGDHW
jgi:hypothetical protein